MAAIIGRKLGMTQIYDDEGNTIPVTVIEAGPCPVVQVKSDETDGYRAVQIGYGAQKAKRSSNAELGHARNAGLDYAPRALREFRVEDPEGFEVGEELTVEQFETGARIKVTGTSKGRGFQGVVKRYGFATRPGSHGHPQSRNPGAIGPGIEQSRVPKGKKMPGQMGNKRHTERNLRIARIDTERNLIFVHGAVPGSRNSLVFIREA